MRNLPFAVLRQACQPKKLAKASRRDKCKSFIQTMATYVYETIPVNPKDRPRRFEVEQKMSDPPLEKDPKTGLPVRRVIVGGSGLVTHGASILSMNVKRSRK
jgi:hypothetical protein